MSENYQTIKVHAPNRNKFDLSYTNFLSTDFGKLTPVCCQPMVPGDTVKVSHEALLRFAPLMAPIYSHIDVTFHTFFVPSRLLWSDWTKFVTLGKTNFQHQGGTLEIPYSFYEEIGAACFLEELNTIPTSVPGKYRVYYNNLTGIVTFGLYQDQNPYQYPQLSYEVKKNNNGVPTSILIYSPINSMMDYLNLPTGLPVLEYPLTPYTPSGQSTLYYVDIEIAKEVENPHWPTSIGFHKQPISLLPFLACYKIWYDYYRDENLQTDIQGYSDPEDLADTLAGHVSLPQLLDSDIMMVMNRAYTKDYFTAALPSAQRGNSVLLPLDGTAQVRVTPLGLPATSVTSGNYSLGVKVNNNTISDTNVFTTLNSSNAASGLNAGLYAVLGDANTSTINDLRTAIRVQEFMERSLLGGNRYIETLAAIYGVISSDARLQRPQYISGTRQSVQISDVIQNAPFANDQESSPLGDYTGLLRGYIQNYDADSYYAEEFGYLVSFMSVMPEMQYFQGIPRHFQMLDRYEQFIPQFSNLGLEAVKNKELYFDNSVGETAEQDLTFGYQDRYSYMKSNLSQIHGNFRQDMLNWTQARKYSDTPALSQDFIVCNAKKHELNRIFSYTGGDFPKIYASIDVQMSMLRPLPIFGEPQL